MAYNWNDPLVGLQQIDETSTVQNHESGLRACAVDTAGVRGEAEFIYLQGVASTAIGDLCAYDLYAGTTTRTVAATRGPVGVAMSANVASQWGWYQIFGAATITAGTVADVGQVYSTATAGSVDDAVTSGSLVMGARFETADGTPSAGFAIASLTYPSMSGLG